MGTGDVAEPNCYKDSRKLGWGLHQALSRGICLNHHFWAVFFIWHLLWTLKSICYVHVSPSSSSLPPSSPKNKQEKIQIKITRDFHPWKKIKLFLLTCSNYSNREFWSVCISFQWAPHRIFFDFFVIWFWTLFPAFLGNVTGISMSIIRRIFWQKNIQSWLRKLNLTWRWLFFSSSFFKMATENEGSKS